MSSLTVEQMSFIPRRKKQALPKQLCYTLSECYAAGLYRDKTSISATTEALNYLNIFLPNLQTNHF